MGESLEARLSPALSRGAYLDDAVWARECQLLFARSWCVVGRESDVESVGDFLCVELAGESVIVTRDDSGGLRGFFNVCRHRGAQLVDASGEARGAKGAFPNAIRCPYHGWTYGLDGELHRAPFLGSIEDADASAFALAPVAVECWGGFVFARLAGESTESLADQLEGIPGRVTRYPLDQLRRGARITYEVEANWKLLAENYNECYHCGSIHPELCDLVPEFRRGGAGDLDWERGIPHRDGAYTFTTSGTTTRAPFPDLDRDERVRHKGELAYPNLFLSLACDHAAAFVLLPRSATHTTVELDLLFHPDEIAKPEFDPSDAVELWDVVNRQDWAICESVQRGMSSRGFTQGWFAPMEDPSLDLRAWYEPRMDERSE